MLPNVVKVHSQSAYWESSPKFGRGDARHQFEGDAHCVFGNTEDRHTSTLLAIKRSVNLHGDLGELEIDGKKIAFIHNDKLGRLLAEAGKYDAVFHGHNHKFNSEMVNNTLLTNPGNLAGFKGNPTYAIYDTETNKVEKIEFK